MAITLVQSVPASGSGTSLSVSLTATAGNTLVVIAAARGASLVTSDLGPDSAGNEYNRDDYESVGVSEGASDYKLLEVWSSRVVTGGSISLTYTVSPAATGLSLVVQEWAGLYTGAVEGGGPGAAWIDEGFGVGAGPFGTLTLHIDSDFPALAAAYGTARPLVGVTASFRSTLDTSYTYYPAATDTVSIDFPSFPIGTTACAICVLYIGPISGDEGAEDPPTPPSSVYLDLWVWRQLHTFTALDEDLNFPPGYAKALLYALARELHLDYPAAAKKYEFEELVADAEEASTILDAINASNAVAQEPTV